MNKWLFQLEGDKFDLEELLRGFPDGEAYVIERDGEYFIGGPIFENLSDASAVHDEAIRVLDRYAAVISLLNPGFRKPAQYKVIQEMDGQRKAYVFASAHLTIRAKLTAVGTLSSDSAIESVQETQAQELIRGALADPHLDLALSVWSETILTWPQLYRILEEIEMYLGKHVYKAGLCSSKARERFTRTANAAEVAGVNARHAAGKSSPPSNPMSLEEARDFIRRLLIGVLHRRLGS